MAFGAHHSYSSHYVPRILLLQHGIDLYRLQDYGGLRLDVARQYLEREPGLRILATSPPLPPHLIVASPRLAPATRQAVQQSLLSYRPPDGNSNSRRIVFARPDHVLAEQVEKVVEIVERRDYQGPWPW